MSGDRMEQEHSDEGAGLVAVEQVDREAAAPFVIVPGNDRKIRAGEMDWNPLVQAFARHRLATDHAKPEQGERAQIVALRCACGWVQERKLPYRPYDADDCDSCDCANPGITGTFEALSPPAPSSIAEQGAVAWRYVKYDGEELFRSSPMKFDPDFWTETPLYASPPASPAQNAALVEALEAAERHFGPFADITINGQHDPEDVRVVALMGAALAKQGAVK